MFIVLIVLNLLHQIILGNGDSSQTVVKLNLGEVKGYIGTTTNGITYYGYRAIPYAKPPMDSLRFKPPEPVEPWSCVLDATQDGHVCPQPNRWATTTFGSEDCLHLSVYTTQIVDFDNLLPVMVWFHGGGFIMGSGNLPEAGIKDFLDYQVVLVTFNYRLGILGFLSTEDSSSYGNYGMLDQVMVLKWVQQNIVKFGGDPNKVTIFGVSAGAGSVSHHILSPLSKGLFHKAIAQSGTSLNYWAVEKHPLKYARQIANLLDCPKSNTSENIMECLSTKSVEEIIVKPMASKPFLLFPIEFAPTIDVIDGAGFLPEDPLTLIKEGRIANKVPVIFGMTADEGYSVHFDIFLNSKMFGKKYFDEQFPEHLSLFSPFQPNMTLVIKEIAKNYYDRSDLDDNEVFHTVVSQIMGDAIFAAGISKTVELFSKAGIPTYAYKFNHTVEACMAKVFGGYCSKSCSHGDDFALQFKLNAEDGLNDDSAKMQRILNTLWTLFARDRNLDIGNEVLWPLYEVANPKYVELTLPPKIQKSQLSEKMKLWTDVLPNLMHKENLKFEL
ncbi:hypothetical protein CHUAL_009796 [Chamberlinius hualienensis]